MEDKYILDEKGNPKPEQCQKVWKKWFDENSRKIAFDRCGDLKVSTVFLGVNHNFGEGDPLIYATMVFNGGRNNEASNAFYPTKEDALKGHQDLIIKYSV